ncbi:hypothetical protein ACC691_37360, partial [Rhizobium johnstonii]
AAETLSTRTREAAAFAGFPKLFASVGVRLVYVEAFPGSKMNGASFLLDEDPNRQVIALSGRGKRLDIVLFTLLHEVAHLILGDVEPGGVVIDEDSMTHTVGDESAADALAE